jgi:hypothetical protein
MIWTFLFRSLKKTRSRNAVFLLALGAFIAGVWPARAAETPDYPVFVARLPNPNDYSLFANSGWDGNWYLGYNTCWIKKLPPVPEGHYQRAYIGAKLGRAKFDPTDKSPRDRRALPADFYIALASTTAWNSSQQHLLTTSADIPAEGESENALEGSGESEWFWTEVPITNVSMGADNFIALWSNTKELMTVSSSPVVAAGWGGKDMDTWLARDTQGAPPSTPLESPGLGISYFQPAIALKLIPKGPPHPIVVRIISWQSGTKDHLKPVVTASVAGDSIERVWLEYNPVGSSGPWKKIGRPLWKAPYAFSLEMTQLPRGHCRLRVVAANLWEETSASQPFTVEVSIFHEK